jgi:cytoskeleton protein RodZ
MDGTSQLSLTPHESTPIFLIGNRSLRMASTPFGEHLKREREMRGVSLEEISAATRISTRFLEALENEQWEQLPGGVFNRGFIRSVARFLGLDEESLVSEYALEAKNRIGLGVVPEPPAESGRNWVPAIVVLILIAAIFAGGWIVYDRYGARILARLHRHSTSSASPSPKASDLPDATKAGENETAPGITPSAPEGATAVNSGAGVPLTTATPTGQDQPMSHATDPLELKIEAGKAADVKVVADRKIVFDGHVEPGDVKRFTAADSLEITASESSALLLDLNGQTVAPIGQPGQPGSITLTRADLKGAGGGLH